MGQRQAWSAANWSMGVWWVKSGCSSASISAFYPLRHPHIRRSAHPPFTEAHARLPTKFFSHRTHLVLLWLGLSKINLRKISQRRLTRGALLHLAVVHSGFLTSHNVQKKLWNIAHYSTREPSMFTSEVNKAEQTNNKLQVSKFLHKTASHRWRRRLRVTTSSSFVDIA